MTDKELKDKILELSKDSTFEQLENACLSAIRDRLVTTKYTGVWAAQKWVEYVDRVKEKAKIFLTNAKKKAAENPTD